MVASVMTSTDPKSGKKPVVRPRDAATLIVYRRDEDAIRLLMGRRAPGMAFMPGALVFPGGRIERGDRRAPSVDALHPAVESKLQLISRFDAARARALALAAVRETFEETGYLLGESTTTAPAKTAPGWEEFLGHGVVPRLSDFRMVARAITPPKMPRRFDARFFAVQATAIAKQVPVPDDELESPAWVTFAEALAHDTLPHITRLVLTELQPRLIDGDLAPDADVNFRRMRRGKFGITVL